MLGAARDRCGLFRQTAPTYPGRMHATDGATGSLKAIATSALDALLTATPDTGDDTTQIALDDLLTFIEERLRRLAEDR